MANKTTKTLNKLFPLGKSQTALCLGLPVPNGLPLRLHAHLCLILVARLSPSDLLLGPVLFFSSFGLRIWLSFIHLFVDSKYSLSTEALRKTNACRMGVPAVWGLSAFQFRGSPPSRGDAQARAEAEGARGAMAGEGCTCARPELGAAPPPPPPASCCAIEGALLREALCSCGASVSQLQRCRCPANGARDLYLRQVRIVPAPEIGKIKAGK